MGRTIWTVVVSWLGQDPISRAGYTQRNVRRDVARTIDGIAAEAREPSVAIAAQQMLVPLLEIDWPSSVKSRVVVDVNGAMVEMRLEVIRSIESPAD